MCIEMTIWKSRLGLASALRAAVTYITLLLVLAFCAGAC